MTKKSKLILAYYLLVAGYWLVLYAMGVKFAMPNYIYQFVFGLIPLTGGLLGIKTAKKWGMLKSKVGRAVLFLSLGLITWGVGQMIWSYYTIFSQVETPYPSLADVGYVLSWPLWAIGMVNLSKATGAKFSLRRVKGKLMLLIIPLLASLASYYLLIVVARDNKIDFTSGTLKLFFDFAYPLGDVVILTLALLIFGLSSEYLGGKFKLPILAIIIGFVLNYFTDFAFSYTTTATTYYNGHWVDLMFPTVMALLAAGVNSLDPTLIEQGGE